VALLDVDRFAGIGDRTARSGPGALTSNRRRALRSDRGGGQGPRSMDRPATCSYSALPMVQRWATTTHLRPSSRARVESIMRGHLLPHFGAQPLASIRTTDIRAFFADLFASGLASATVRKVFNVLHSILGAAEESGVIGRSPCLGIRLAAPTRTEPRFLTPGEIERLALAVNKRYSSLIPGGSLRRAPVRRAHRATGGSYRLPAFSSHGRGRHRGGCWTPSPRPD
jgi:hypothetical protein